MRAVLSGMTKSRLFDIGAVVAGPVTCCLFVLLFSFFCVMLCLPASCQSAGPRTVGDGTVFLFNPGKSEGYGIYSGDIGGTVGEPTYTRHHRLGQSTGIGASTLGTTSATSESMPSEVSTFAPAASQFTLNRPALPSPFAATTSGSPALGVYTVTPTEGLYSGSGLTSPYAEMRSPFSTQLFQQPSAGVFQDMNAVPSFVKQHSKAVLPLSGFGDDQIFKNVQPQF